MRDIIWGKVEEPHSANLFLVLVLGLAHLAGNRTPTPNSIFSFQSRMVSPKMLDSK